MTSLKLLRPTYNSPFFNEVRNEMKVDIIDKEKEYTLFADIPGVDKENIDLQISDDGVLTIEVNHTEENKDKKENYIRRERMMTNTKRYIAFEGVQIDEVDASVSNGVLTVKLPKVVIREKNIEIK